MLRVALYARVSTWSKKLKTNSAELRRYVDARCWATAVEYVDNGVSGAKRSPACPR